MLPAELLGLYDATMRFDARVAGCARETTSRTSRYTTATGSLRYVMWHRFDERDSDEAISHEETAATGHAQALMWKVYEHDTPSAHLRERLLARGFAEHDPCALMVASVAQVLDALPEVVADIVVRQLLAPDELDAYQQIWDAVWPDAPNARYVNDYRRLATDHDPGVAFFAGFAEGDVPVTSGYMFLSPTSPFAHLCGGATRAPWRNRHAYTAMLAARAQHALARGAAFLSVDASSQSQPILQRLGFARLSNLLFYEKTLSA